MTQQDRAVTPVISTTLVVAIVIILASTVSVVFFDIAEDINEPAPNIADSTGEFEPQTDGFRTNQIVRITHVAGEDVAVEELEIVVRASGPEVNTEARLVNLPADDDDFDRENFDDGDPDNLIDDGSFISRNSVIISDGIDVWSAGDTIQFRINTGTADFREGEDPEADKLEVILVHTPSNAIISKHTFRP